MRHLRSTTLILCSLGLLWFSPVSHAQTNLLTTNVVASGSSWLTAIWKTNNGAGVPTGTAVAPVAGNTYTMIYNGTLIGNSLNNTRVRCPATLGLVTFPGDSLTMNTNTELRFKNNGDGANGQKGVFNTLNFPGVGNNPGLILNGGALGGGDDGTFAITGRVSVASASFIFNGANGGGGGISANRAFMFTGVLSGTGSLTILISGTNVAQSLTCTSNTFSGPWIVQAGWLLGSGTNSLGTNSITVDPGYSGFLAAMPSAASPNGGGGSAVLEVGYDMNSAGVLTIQNGGVFRLHQNCEFSAVIIDGNPLDPGTHFAADLIAQYPDAFPPNASGTITVQPYGPPPKLSPIITLQPAVQTLYAGGTAHFNTFATSAGTITYHWQKGGINLTDGGNILGSTTSNLVVSAVSAGDVAGYDVVVANAEGSTTSTIVSLNLEVPAGSGYQAAVLAAQPVAFYELNEIDDPATSPTAYDYVGGFNGTYGTGVEDGNPGYGITGPLPSDGYPGFPNPNGAALFAHLTPTSLITLPAFNLDTNTVTITAWINPNSTQTAANGVVFCRGGTTVAGLDYTSFTDINGNFTLGYTWNNEPGTYNWNSGLSAPQNLWSFVALVIAPTNATLYVINANGLASSSHAYAHTNQAFEVSTLLGGDNNDGGTGTRGFAGVLDEVGIFNTSLSQSQVVALYAGASGGSVSFAPSIAVQPVTPLSLFVGQTAQFSVIAGGNPQVTYQWQTAPTGSGAFVNVTDGGQFSGSQTSVLTITNVQVANTADFRVVVANSVSSVTSTTGSLTVQSAGPAITVTMSVQQVAGNDWDSPGDWSNGQSATETSFSNPGSLYEVLTGARIRTPAANPAAVFPGAILQIDGNAIYSNSPAAGAPTAEVRFKQEASGNTVYFPKLVMNGGQLDNGNPGLIIIQGEIDILTNTPIYVDSGGGTGRPYEIDSFLTGSGSIEYHDFDNSLTSDLNITGTSNTFSGTWNVGPGVLLGTGLNSLGTNSIFIATNGALETTYDLNIPQANVAISGEMFLHQNDTFGSLVVGTTALAPGVYPYSQLHTNFAANFPATWPPQVGATNFTVPSGSITVVRLAPPSIITQPNPSQTFAPTQTGTLSVVAVGGAPLTYQWQGGVPGSGSYTNVVNGGSISGATSSTLTLANLAQGSSGDYVVVVANTSGSATSSVGNITVLPTMAAENITLAIQEAAGLDWDSVTNWSDGLSATISSLTKPGSTYEVLPNARLRTPAGTANARFPGDVLTLDGDGVWESNPGAAATVGELRTKQPAGGDTVYFPRLVMNGGQIDNGNAGLIIIQGEMDIVANSPIYVDTGGGTGRPYQIDAFLTGTASIEYHDFDNSLTSDLNITGTSNTYSGTWLVGPGVLLGSGFNSLGTNAITVLANGAFETTYNIITPGTLNLNGLMYLHQNDAFSAVNVNGVALATGTYLYSQLHTTYPASFPASWSPVPGSSFTTASGSIRVLGSNPYVPPSATSISNVQVGAGGAVSFTFTSQAGAVYTVQYKNNLNDAAWISLPSAVGTGGTMTLGDSTNAGAPQRFYRLEVN